MFSRNIPLNTLDFTGKRSDNLVEGEYYRRLDTSSNGTSSGGQEKTVFVPRTGPFYIDSVVLTRPTGEELVEGTHYEFYGIATALTAFIKDKEVGIFITIIDETITEWFASYQVVGHFGILNQDLVNIVNSAIGDERPVYYKNIRNKPKWFNPTIHLHDLRWGIHSFQDLVDGIKSIGVLKSNTTPRATIAIEHFNSVIMSHINDFESMLLGYIQYHNNEVAAPYGNVHGVTAAQVELENVDNFETATLQQIIDGFRKDLHVTVDLAKQAIEHYGVTDDNLIKYGTLPIIYYKGKATTDGAFTLNFPAVSNIILNGRSFSLDAYVKNLQDVIANPANKTFYVYIDYNETGIYYNVSPIALAETPSRALITIVNTNDTVISSIVDYDAFTMDGVRISTSRHGSSIPAATGSITSQGQLEDWVTKNRP